jgi:[acyl-carrier-protein] S-malonyltransferase
MMKKIAYLFSGQGSQYVGMGLDLYKKYELVSKRFNQAKEVLGYDVVAALNDEKKINDTLYIQPLMFTLQVAILDLLEEKGIHSNYTCGLSLGEYGALYDASCIDFESGLRLLQLRAKAMKMACDKTQGKMTAIIGISKEELEQLLSFSTEYVTIANYNTVGQMVISGVEEAVLDVSKQAEKKGAKVIPLNTSGAFHSELMNLAKTQFSKQLSNFHIQNPNKNLYVNVTGDLFTGDLRQVMSEQIVKSVRFQQIIEKLLEEDIDYFIEIGPKRTLSSFVKKMNRKAKVLHIENDASLQKTLKQLEGIV